MSKNIIKNINKKVFENFFSSKSSGGILLLVCVILSLGIANSSLNEMFTSALQTPFGYESESLHLRYPLLIWINDGLMAIFFLYVGLEIKRELVEGELSSLKKATLPIFAAIGGMLLPALIYSLVNNDPATEHGWGIPMATDIAFAIAILGLLGDKVPNALKIFLTALAIVDDLGAIVVIAFFYTQELHTEYIIPIIGALAVLGLLNFFNVKTIFLYLIPGAFLWYFVHGFGVHATIAGVLTAFFLPTTPDATESPLEKLEHSLSIPVSFIIMPIFALANTNITFEAGMVDGLINPIGMGIILGLLLGKTFGISLMSFLAVKLKFSNLPENTSWSQIIGAGALAGIGFTMSIFIALLSFGEAEFRSQAKFSILVASLLAGIIGYSILNFINKKKVRQVY